MTTLPGDVLLGIGFGAIIGLSGALLAAVAAIYFVLEGENEPPLKYRIAALFGFGLLNAFLVGIVTADIGVLVRVPAAVSIVLVFGLFGYSQGATFARNLPETTGRPTERARHLSGEAVDSVDGRGVVTIQPTGEIGDVAGYPALSRQLREELSSQTWRFPADLPLSELEARLEDTLRTRFDLAAVRVTVDPRGLATIEAAPPAEGLSQRIPEGWRAITVEALLPDGLVPGDEVRLRTGSETTTGLVLGTDTDASHESGDSTASRQRAGGPSDPTTAAPGNQSSTNGQSTPEQPTKSVDKPGGDNSTGHGAVGGYGRLTVAVDTAAAGTLLEATTVQVAAIASTTQDDVAAFALFGEVNMTVRHLTLEESTIQRLPEFADRIRVLAVRPSKHREDPSGWIFDPKPNGERSTDDEQSNNGKHSTTSKQSANGRSSSVGPASTGSDIEDVSTVVPRTVDRPGEDPPVSELLNPGAQAYLVGDSSVLKLLAENQSPPSVEVKTT